MTDDELYDRIVKVLNENRKKKETENMTPLTTPTTANAATEKNVEVTRQGKQIVIPEGMKYAEARLWLERKEQSEEQLINVYEEILAFPLDGIHAMMKALAEIYGWVDLQPTPGFFGSRPPAMISVKTGVGTHTQVPWGQIAIPSFEGGWLNTGYAVKDGRVIYVINGQIKKKFLPEVAKIAELTRKFVREASIYKGQAIRVKFPDPEDEGAFHPGNGPEFFDTSKVKEEDLIFPDAVRELVDVNLFTPIEHTERCRQHQIPLKRGILLEGPYGVGKTLTADVTAKKAVQNGWTFIYLENVEQLQQAIYFAQQYQPAVIFAEDVDTATDERDEDMNDILNTLDGIDTKHSEVMVVLTTNFVDNIDKSMIRPGRLDAVVPVRPPDAKAVERLMRLYGRGLLAEGEDISEACRRLDGQIPAVVREVVERSKLSAIRRTGPGETLALLGEDLAVAANSMMAHLELMRETEDDERSNEEKASTILGEHIERAMAAFSTGAALLPSVPKPTRSNGSNRKPTLSANGSNGHDPGLEF